MAKEKLTLIDGMSASLQRIYRYAERLNKQILTLKTNTRSLGKPVSMAYLKRELKETEKQAQQTERAIRALKRAESLNRYGAFSIGKNGKYYVNGIPVKDPVYMGENFARLSDSYALRHNKMLWANGRVTANGTFDERVALVRGTSRSIQSNKMFTTVSSFNEAMNSTTSGIFRFRNAIIGTAVTLGSLSFLADLAKSAVGVVTEPMNRYTSNFMRANLTSDSKYTPREMMQQLYDTAIRTRSDARGTMMLYNRIAMSGVRASNEDIRRFVETFNKTMMISGTSKQENRAVMLQLAQGMGSNRLGGDEFRSIAEQAPMFKYMLAKGMGVNPGALKQMGAQGLLTADAIMKAMKNVQDLVDLIAKDAPLQVDQVLIIIESKWEKFMSQNMMGYIAIRDLLKQISDWMDTTQGQETMNLLVSSMNILIYRSIQFLKMLRKPILFVITHLRQIGKLIRVILTIWALANWQVILASIVSGLGLIQAGLIRIITQVGSLGYAFIHAGTFATSAMGGMVAGIRGVGVALHAWIPELLVILGLMLAITKLVPHMRKESEIKHYVEAKLPDKFSQAQIDEYHRIANSMTGPAPLPATDTYVMVSKEAKRLREQYYKDHPKEGTPEYYNKIAKESMEEFEKMQKLTEGTMNSANNIPIVGKVNEVGKINDKISIDNDGIEMMKAIAERQWVMQNEVTVPQNVNVTVTKEVDVDEERLADAFTGGMRLAVASSMRGAPVS